MALKKNNNLVIEFSNEEAREHFAVWLSEQGEQDYWIWMECRETEEEGDITATRFDYRDDICIKTKCGRIDDRHKNNSSDA